MFVDTMMELACAQLRVAGVPDDATTGFSIKRFASAFEAEKADILSQDDAEALCARMERQAEMIVKRWTQQQPKAPLTSAAIATATGAALRGCALMPPTTAPAAP